MTRFTRTLSGIAALGALCLSATTVVADEGKHVHEGRSKVYRDLSPESLESLTTPSKIQSLAKGIANGTVAPTELWKGLEHGEKIECLSCIPAVSKLLYNDHAKTREISAWWLRRRIFGVFGPGQVYSQTVDTLNDPGASERKRAYAADALGEFLSASGAKHLAKAATSDSSALVRMHAVKGLRRMNTVGPGGELSQTLGDKDEEVRLAAVQATTRINAFVDIASLVKRIDDSSARVRKSAAEALGSMRAGDAVLGLTVLTASKTEDDPLVRTAACAALGRIGDPAARPALEKALKDKDQFVRDAARIALRRL